MNEPEQDREHVQRFVVEIPTFGKPSKTAEELQVRVARAVHHMVKRGATIQHVEQVGRSNLSRRGKPYRFDAKGDDMGHHGPEHPDPLVPVTP